MAVVSALRQADLLKGNTNDPQHYFKVIGEAALSGFEPLNDQILVATYMRPERTAGGILLAPKSQDEDRFQGRTGVLLKAGPDAFGVDARGYEWRGRKPAPGDWLVFHYSDAREVMINGISCRTLRASAVHAIVADPSTVF